MIAKVLPFDLDKEYLVRGLPAPPPEVEVFESQFYKGVNILRTDPKFFSNNVLEQVIKWYVIQTGYVSFDGKKEKWESGVKNVD